MSKPHAHRPDLSGFLNEKTVPVKSVFERSREAAETAEKRRREGSLPGPSSSAGRVRSIDPGEIGMFEPERRKSPYWDDAAFRKCQRAETRRLNPPKPRTEKSRVKKPSLDELMAQLDELVKSLSL